MAYDRKKHDTFILKKQKASFFIAILSFYLFDKIINFKAFLSLGI